MSETKTALIVDDSKLSRAMINTILSQNFPDWRIFQAADAIEALSLNEPVIDVITLDMNMPGMDGITLGGELRKRYPNASISLITANIQNAVRERADVAGLYFVSKPITEEKILDAIGADVTAGSVDTTDMIFDVDELDVIAEYFNMGMGQSANAISQMLGYEVHLSVPSVRFTSRQKSVNEINLKKEEVVVCVSEDFNGLFDGKALMLFPDEDSRSLLKLFNIEESNDAEEDMMKEVGNVLINNCLSTIYNLMDSSYECSIPHYTKHKVISLFESISYTSDDSLLVIEMDFKIDSTDITGSFRLLMDLDNVDELKTTIKKQLG
jgi:chemotaxis protein CheY-P-specific phosphatase CheC